MNPYRSPHDCLRLPQQIRSTHSYPDASGMGPQELSDYIQGHYAGEHCGLVVNFIRDNQISGQVLLTTPEDEFSEVTSDPQLCVALKEVVHTLPGIRLTPGKRRFRRLSELAHDLEEFQPPMASVSTPSQILHIPIDLTEPPSPWDLDTPIPSPVSDAPHSSREEGDGDGEEDETYYKTATDGVQSILGCGDSAVEEGETEYTDARASTIYADEGQRDGTTSPSFNLHDPALSSRVHDWLANGQQALEGRPSVIQDDSVRDVVSVNQTDSDDEPSSPQSTPGVPHHGARNILPEVRDNEAQTSPISPVYPDELRVPPTQPVAGPAIDALEGLSILSALDDTPANLAHEDSLFDGVAPVDGDEEDDDLLFQYVGGYVSVSEAESDNEQSEEEEEEEEEEEVEDEEEEEDERYTQEPPELTQEMITNDFAIRIRVDEESARLEQSRPSITVNATSETSRSRVDKGKGRQLSVDTSHLSPSQVRRDHDYDFGNDSGIETTPALRQNRPLTPSSATSSVFAFNVTLQSGASRTSAQIESSMTTTARPSTAPEMGPPLSGKALLKKFQRRSEVVRQIEQLQEELESLDRVLQMQPDIPRRFHERNDRAHFV